MKNKWYKWVILLCLSSLTSGCFLTKAVTVPMRIGGAIISGVPLVGGVADEVIDSAADMVDKIPI